MFLVLDDFGVDLSPQERRQALELLDRRSQWQRSTCLTTNWSPEEISKHMDERLVSRLSGFRWLCLEGQDLRQFPKIREPKTIEINEAVEFNYEAKKKEALKLAAERGLA